MPKTIPDCARDIYKKGEHIATLDARADAAERWVKMVAAGADARLDWHYFGGRVVVKFLGGEEDRRRVFEVIEALKASEESLQVRMLRAFGPNDPPATHVLPWPLPQGKR